jgi:hypothetical protein
MSSSVGSIVFARIGRMTSSEHRCQLGWHQLWQAQLLLEKSEDLIKDLHKDLIKTISRRERNSNFL